MDNRGPIHEFCAVRNHDFSGCAADLEDEEGFNTILMVIFLWEATSTFRILIHASHLDCCFMSTGQVMMF